MRASLASSRYGVAALACAAALSGCGGASADSTSSWGTSAGAMPRYAPGDAAWSPPPPPCSPAMLDVIPAAPPPSPLRAGLLECALAEARAIGGVAVRAMVVDRIAAGLAGAQSYRRAVEVACELAPDVSRRMMMLQETARALARGGHVDHAIRLTEAMEQTPRDEGRAPGPSYPPPQVLPPDLSDTSSVWVAIATEQAGAGELPRALESIRRIRGLGSCEAELAVVRALRSRGRDAEAQPLLDACAESAAISPMTMSSVLVQVAELYASGGRRERAAALLRGAIRALEGVGKWGPGSRAELSAALGKLGLYQESIQLLAGHAEVQAGLAAELAKAGELDAARFVAGAIRDGTWRAHAMAALAQALDERGDARRAEAAWQEGRDAAVSVAFPRFKVEALSHVAVQLSRARRAAEAERMLSEAVDLAESIGDADEKKSALAEAAVAHATIGRCVRALDIAGDLGDSGYSIREIAASCADPGDYDEIHARMTDIKYPDHRGQALGDLAVKYAEGGRLDRALTLVSEIERPEERAKALAALGAAALRAGGSPPPGCPGRAGARAAP